MAKTDLGAMRLQLPFRRVASGLHVTGNRQRKVQPLAGGPARACRQQQCKALKSAEWLDHPAADSTSPAGRHWQGDRQEGRHSGQCSVALGILHSFVASAQCSMNWTATTAAAAAASMA